MHLVPAERQVGRERERRPPHEASVDRARFDVDVDLRELPSTAADLRVELEPDLDGVAVRDVHRDVTVTALPDDDDGRQHAPPRHVLDVRGGQGDPRRGRGVDAERPEDAAQRVGGDVAAGAVEPPVVRGDAVGASQAQQLVGRALLVVGHGPILPEGSTGPQEQRGRVTASPAHGCTS